MVFSLITDRKVGYFQVHRIIHEGVHEEGEGRDLSNDCDRQFLCSQPKVHFVIHIQAFFEAVPENLQSKG
jgi:hypothetical protein